MIIPINDKFRITSDRHQWMVQEKRTRQGNPKWESRQFYPTFQMALGWLGERLVRESKAETLAEALVDVRNVTTMLSRALTVDCGVREDGITVRRADIQDGEV